jgi:nickel-dependent lactate racemase
MIPFTMHVELAFGRGTLGLEVAGNFEYRVLDSLSGTPVSDPISAVEAALDDPLAGPPLTVLAAGKRSAAISVCDITRPAPNALVLPPLLRRLEVAGIRKECIRILVATGLHRAATPDEVRQIVGEEIAAQFAVLNHDARNPNEHRHLGSTRSGTPVWIDERFLAADLHLSLGFIEPHLMLGFSGGRKLIAPGLAAEATIKQLHSSRFMRDPRAKEGSIADNPLHAELLEIARMARHDFLVDVSLTRARRIAAVFAGEPEAAHRAGVNWVRGALLQRLDQPADAVITSGGGYPLDLTFYQSIKGVTAAAQIVRPGGRILLVAGCQEGTGAPEFRQMVAQYRSDRDFMRAIENVPVTIDQWQLEKLALAARKAKIFYCVPGLPEECLAGLWGPAFKSPEPAAKAFLADLPAGSRVVVIPDGPYVLAEANGKIETNGDLQGTSRPARP